jgi:hypothetical protein
MVEDFTVIATAAISGTVGVLAALVGAYTSAHVANVETRRRQWDYLQKRRAERQETYQAAIDLLTDWGWRQEGDPTFDTIRDFTVPFVRVANRVRVYGSPASVAAMDEIQEGFARLNAAKTENEEASAYEAVRTGHDHLVVAARADVGPRPDDGLAVVPFREGAGPTA